MVFTCGICAKQKSDVIHRDVGHEDYHVFSELGLVDNTKGPNWELRLKFLSVTALVFFLVYLMKTNGVF